MEDTSFINSLFNHPQIAPFIRDDGISEDFNADVESLLRNPNTYFLIMLTEKMERAGCFFLHPWNTVCFEVHTMILPEYRGWNSIKFGRQAIKWFFNRTKCKKVVTQVPTFNVRAYALARKVGFKVEGKNESSFLWRGKLYDQFLMGLKKEN